MSIEINELGQPIGALLTQWQASTRPSSKVLSGQFCTLEPLSLAQHADELYAANTLDVDGRNWTYLPYGPFASLQAYRTWIEASCASTDPLFFAVLSAATGKAVGIVSFLRIDPSIGSIEIGHLNFSPLMQKTAAATQAIFLLLREAFALGYRRVEWKCHALNEPSRRAALRFGFKFEGIFRQATIVKGRNRDTAWYSIIDQEWPLLDAAFQTWFAPSNFDPKGQQLASLAALRQPAS